jgi:hypothetical protein
MMPMPPTRSEIDATAASRSATVRLELSAVSTNWLRFAHVEIVDGAGLDAVAANERVARLANGGMYLRLAQRLHVYLVDKAGEPRLQIVRIGPRQIRPIERHLLRGRRRDAEHFALGGGEWRHHQIILIGAEHRLAFGGEYADHLTAAARF